MLTMANPVFDALKGGAPNTPMNPMQMLNALRSDPSAFLRSRGLNIPQGMNNPQQIINHLLQSGQVPQSRYAQVLQNMQRMKR
jgi:hypothetical protein